MKQAARLAVDSVLPILLGSQSVLWMFITIVLSYAFGSCLSVCAIIFTWPELSGPALSVFGHRWNSLQWSLGYVLHVKNCEMDYNSCQIHTKSYWSLWSFETVPVSVLCLKASAPWQLTKNVIFIVDQTTLNFFFIVFFFSGFVVYQLAEEDFKVLVLEKTYKKTKLAPKYCIVDIYYSWFLLVADSILWWILCCIFSRIKNLNKLVLYGKNNLCFFGVKN